MRWLFVGALAFVCFGLIGWAVRRSVPAPDAWGFRTLHVTPEDGWPEGLEVAAEVLVAAVGVSALVVLVVGLVGRRLSGSRALRYLALVLVGQSMAFFKEVFTRPEPGGESATEFSYPSGHTGLALTLTVVLLLLVAELHRRWLGRVLVAVGAVVVVTATSRLVVGEHYLTDLVGTLLGVLGILLVTAVLLGLFPVPTSDDRRDAASAGNAATRHSSPGRAAS